MIDVSTIFSFVRTSPLTNRSADAAGPLLSLAKPVVFSGSRLLALVGQVAAAHRARRRGASCVAAVDLAAVDPTGERVYLVERVARAGAGGRIGRRLGPKGSSACR